MKKTFCLLLLLASAAQFTMAQDTTRENRMKWWGDAHPSVATLRAAAPPGFTQSWAWE